MILTWVNKKEIQCYHGKKKNKFMKERLIRVGAFLLAICLIPFSVIEWVIRGKCTTEILFDYAVTGQIQK